MHICPINDPVHSSRMRAVAVAALVVAAASFGGCQSASVADLNADPINTATTGEVSYKETAELGKKWRANTKDLSTGIKYAKQLKALSQPDKQLAVLEELKRNHPENHQLAAYFGKELVQAGQAQRAEEELSRVAKAGKADWRAYSALGSALDQQGKYTEARRYYLSALKSRPNEISVMNNLGMSHLLEGNLKEAEAVLRKANSLPASKATPQIRQNLALAVGLQGRFDDAKKIASQDLPANMVEANMVYLKKMLAQQNSWQKLQTAGTKSPG